MSLLEEMNQKATAQGIPLSAHLDITWRCNERCVHCYLDHEGKNEMSTDEMKDVLVSSPSAGPSFSASAAENLSCGATALRFWNTPALSDSM